jgi:hypothetical protein
LTRRIQKRRKDTAYSKFTISVIDDEWNLVRQEASRQGVSISRFVMDALRPHLSPNSSESRIHLKYYRNWFDYEHERDWGNEMWVCSSHLSSFYFLGSPFFEARAKTRYYSESDWQTHAEHSRRYHERFIEHLEKIDGFMCRSIYSAVAMQELVKADSRFGHVPKEVIIDGLETMIVNVEKYWSKADIAFLNKPLNLNFHVYQSGDRLWGSIFGDFLYADTTDSTFLKGLIHEEFAKLLGKCSIRDKKPVIDFLNGLIKQVKERPDSHLSVSV